jgi:transcriptional regulator with XRE-family HTH domain
MDNQMARRAAGEEQDFDKEVEVEALMVHLADLIAEVMENSGVTRAELARRMGVSPAHITQTLGGQRNMTLKTVAEALYAMGHYLAASAVLLTAGQETSIDYEPRESQGTCPVWEMADFRQRWAQQRSARSDDVPWREAPDKEPSGEQLSA